MLHSSVLLFCCKLLMTFQSEELWSDLLLLYKKMNVNVLECDLFCIDSSHSTKSQLQFE